MTTTKPQSRAWTPPDPEGAKADRWSGMSLTEIAKKYGISNVEILRKWLTREGVVLSREQILANTRRARAASNVDPGAEALIALTAESWPLSEIAKRLSISEASVTLYRRKYGISTTQPQPKAESSTVPPVPIKAAPVNPTPVIPEPTCEAPETMADAPPPYRGWTPLDPETVKADRLSGMRIVDIVVKLRKQSGTDQNATIDKVNRWLASEGVFITPELVQETRKRLNAERRAMRDEKRATRSGNAVGKVVKSDQPAPKQANQPQGWSPANPEAVKADRLNGKTLNEIIASIRAQDASDAVTTEKLRKWLVKESVFLSPEQRNENAKRISAEKRDESKRAAHNAGKTRDPGREVLEELAKSGLTRQQIAAKIGVSDTTITTYLGKHGITVTGRSSGDPSRRKIREALATSPTKEAAADKLGISKFELDRLVKRHRIVGAGNAGRESSKRAMTAAARASIAETRAKQENRPKIVGTDTRAMIDAAIAAGMITKYPPAFCAETTRDPLSEEDREKLIEYRKRRDAA